MKKVQSCYCEAYFLYVNVLTDPDGGSYVLKDHDPLLKVKGKTLVGFHICNTNDGDIISDPSTKANIIILNIFYK